MKLQNMISRVPFLSSAVIGGILAAFVVGEAHAQVIKGSIFQSDPGADVFYDESLRYLLDSLVPTASTHSTLLIFSHCFGGEAVDNFNGRQNTTVLSATSPGDTGSVYGGYHFGAANALYAGAGRTSTDVHNAGVNESYFRSGGGPSGPNTP